MRIAFLMVGLLLSSSALAQSAPRGVVVSATELQQPQVHRCEPREPIRRPDIPSPGIPTPIVVANAQSASSSCSVKPLPSCSVIYTYEGRRYQTITSGGCPAIGSLIEVRPTDRRLR